MKEKPYQLKDHLLTALLASKEAGQAILDVYERDFDVSYKEDLSPLTLADQRSHIIIVDHLTDPSGERFPILSEEGKGIPFEERRKWDYFWLIDPLDGTKEFIKRNGEFTVNIALINQHRPVLGVIFVPVNNVFYFASEGFGAYRLKNGHALELLKSNVSAMKRDDTLKEILKQSDRLPYYDTPLDTHNSQLVIVGSRSHPSKEFEAFVETMRKKHKKVEVVSSGSSLKLCLVAEGKADIYPRLGPTMEWDTAAGQAIVEQANGSVLNYETGEPLQYNKKNLLNSWFIVQTHNNYSFLEADTYLDL
ncbi:MAG: 3'(2'),5'-bisphosphate nucleotidase CysQ [Deltaproteobacteria bacterium]|nr:3'(2'),5'-bisphosphate nucleotidase CysQ [Deltaproteobacteria bacterium]MBW2490331.1 3'(2'),5'-bisphosphate nucleotidase CysQ [Deltaproteobacteria bacterium]